MTAIIERLIYCDGCGDNKNGDDRNYHTLKEMRKARKKEGWVHRGSKDDCPVCVGSHETGGR